MKFELFKRWGLRGPRWYWRLKGANGEIVAQSEGYKNRVDAMTTIDLIKCNVSRAEIVEL